MNYIVLDMEWNQAVSYAKKIKYPINLYGEIIQIGAVKLNDHMETIDTFDVMICPKFYTKMNKNVMELTEITTEQIRKGSPFPKAISEFKNWCGEEFSFITWGNCDEQVLKSNLLIYEMDIEWIPECFDAQLMFDDKVTMEGRDYPLNYAIFSLGIKAKPAHNALNDAINTAEVIKRLDAIEWIEEERMYWQEQRYIN